MCALVICGPVFMNRFPFGCVGSWDQNVQEQLAIYLCIGNRQIKADLLQSLITGIKQSGSLLDKVFFRVTAITASTYELILI